MKVFPDTKGMTQRFIRHGTALTLAAFLLCGCTVGNTVAPPSLLAPVSASTETDIVVRGNIAQEEFYGASVKARMEDLFFDRTLDGFLVQRFERVEGDEVKTGDVILRLNVTKLETELANIEKQLAEQAENARAPQEIFAAEVRIAELQMQLAKEEGASEDDLALMQVALDKKKLTNKQSLAAAEKSRGEQLKRAETLRTQIAQSVLYASCDGIIAKMYVAYGDEVSHRNPVAVIANPAQLYIELDTDANAYDIESNQYVARIGDTDIPLVVEQVNTSAGVKKPPMRFVPQGEAIPPEMILGMFAYVRLVKAEAFDVLYVPRNAVFSTMDGTHVYRMVDNGRGALMQEPVIVQTGITNETYVEIKDGLAEGDVVFVKQ